MLVSTDPWAPYWSHVIEGWDHRHHPNMLFLFYEEMNKVTRLHSNKNMEIDYVTGTMEENYYFLRHGHIPKDCLNKVVQSITLHA
jgi:hypothetical protein